MKVHRAAIARLFETNNQVFDAEAMYALAKELAQNDGSYKAQER